MSELPRTRRHLGKTHASKTDQNNMNMTERRIEAEEIKLENFVITDDKYDFPREEKVPAGYYLSEIIRLEPRRKNGVAILDVCYDLWANDGNVYHIRQSYPDGSIPMKKFHQALIAAGIRPGPNMKDAIGIEEKVHFAYWSDRSDIGSIVERLPYIEPNDTEDAEDDDDYLDEDDE